METKEVVETLYGLRANLSVLSVISDEARASKSRINALNKGIDSRKKAIDNAKSNTKSKISAYANSISSANRKVNSEKEDLVMHRNPIILGTIVLIFSLLFIAAPFVIYIQCDWIAAREWYINWAKDNATIYMGGIFIGSIALAIVALFAGYLQGFCKIRDNYEYYARNRKNLFSYRSEFDRLSANQLAYNSSAETECAETIARLEKEIKEAENSVIKEQGNLDSILLRFKAAYAVAQKEFGTFLDERDWRNVDYIIFNFETGRALDMRDALLQVDNERRAERLETAVVGATREISASIRRASSTMQEGFRVLGSQIAAQTQATMQLARQSAQTAQQIGKLSEQQAAIHAASMAALENGISRIVSSNATQNALLEKINVSSTSMAQDISSMRAYGVSVY